MHYSQRYLGVDCTGKMDTACIVAQATANDEEACGRDTGMMALQSSH
jgi:hypothetical protein